MKKHDDSERHEQRAPRTPDASDAIARTLRELTGGRIVSRRSEGGVPYPGDFPNPLPDKYRGCF